MFNRSRRSQSFDNGPPSTSTGFFRKVAKAMSFKRSSSQPHPPILNQPPYPQPIQAGAPGPPMPFGQYPPYGPGPQYFPASGYNSHPPRQGGFVPPPLNGPTFNTTAPRPHPSNPRPPRDHPLNFSGPQPRRRSDATQNIPFQQAYAPPPQQQEPQSKTEHTRRRHSSTTSHPTNGPQRGSYLKSYDRASYSQPRNHLSSSSNRVDAATQPRQTNAPHVPYFIDHDSRPRRDSDVSSRENVEQRNSSQRRRSNPYASTPRHSNSSLTRAEDIAVVPPQIAPSTRPRLVHNLVPELKITQKVEYPCILYHFWNPPSDAQFWVDGRTLKDVARSTVAINPPVTRLTISSYKHGDSLSIALTRWGDIDIGSPIKPKSITVRDILLGIWDYFQTPISPSDWADLVEDQNLFANIHKCYAYRRGNTRARMPESAMDGATRADTLWGYWVFRGLELDDEFENTRTAYLKVSHYLVQDWNS